MAKAQLTDCVLGLVILFIHKGVKPKVSVIAKIRCKAARKYLLQFDRYYQLLYKLLNVIATMVLKCMRFTCPNQKETDTCMEKAEKSFRIWIKSNK